MSDETQPLVTRLPENDVALPRLAAAPDHINHKGQPIFHFPVKVALETTEGLRKHARVTPGVKGYGAYDLWSDEGTGLPLGRDTAPAPLVYFAAGAAFCLVSHLTDILADRDLATRKIEIESELSFGYVDDQTGHHGTCLGLRYIVDIDSDAPQDELKEALQHAKGMCLAEAALLQPVQIQAIMAVQGEIVDDDVAGLGAHIEHDFPVASE